MFRVIIVGGGPAGLGMAHALSLADIDYVLLERGPNVVVESGAGIALWPHGVRLLDQFGLFERAKPLGIPFQGKRNYKPNGVQTVENTMFAKVAEYHGHPWWAFHRSEFLEMLYEGLPESHRKTRIHVNKNVVDIETDDRGVRVKCGDGTVEAGSIVVGCDGVHSTVRDLMGALEYKDLGRNSNPDRPFKTTYHGLNGYGPRPSHLETGVVYEARNEKRSFHILVGDDRAWFFLYRLLDKPHHDKPEYTNKDADHLAETFKDDFVAPGMTFGDLWTTKTQGRLIDFEEGFVKKWYHGGRIVLLGDSAHKFTPNAGLSLNTGWQGVAELANSLYSLLSTNPEPDANTLESLFQKYQANRERSAKRAGFFSGLYTRAVAWENIVLKVLDWMAPMMGGDVLMLRLLVSPLVKDGITLDYAEEPHHAEGTIPWTHPWRSISPPQGKATGSTQVRELSET